MLRLGKCRSVISLSNIKSFIDTFKEVERSHVQSNKLGNKKSEGGEGGENVKDKQYNGGLLKVGGVRYLLPTTRDYRICYCIKLFILGEPIF